MTNIESIKGKIRHFSNNNNLSSQEILQMYFFERFLDRLSNSPYRDNFIIKGGFLISSLIGIANRTTMDMDTTVKGIPLNEESIQRIVDEILRTPVDDGIEFEIKSIEYIREDDDYENFRVSLIASVGKTKNPMKLDITTGDLITPREIDYFYSCIFSEEKIKLLAYPIETILAEKYESIIKRNIATTRMRDFYDLYILYLLKKEEIDFKNLSLAIERTAKKRNSLDLMLEYREILDDIREDSNLKTLWELYLKENKYIGELSFDEVLDVIEVLSKEIKIENFTDSL